MDQSEIPYDTRHQGVPSGASEIDFHAYGIVDAKVDLQTQRANTRFKR